MRAASIRVIKPEALAAIADFRWPQAACSS
jgi:hypothetical protein